MTIRIDEAALECCFNAIVRAATEGKRCPENGSFGVDSRFTTELARRGRIRVEISGRNYRTVIILLGEHAGKSTTPHPQGAKPWKVIDTRGNRRPQRLAALGAREQARAS